MVFMVFMVFKRWYEVLILNLLKASLGKFRENSENKFFNFEKNFKSFEKIFNLKPFFLRYQKNIVKH